MLLGDVKDIKQARKSHYCWWCGEAIEKGSPYTRWLWKHGREIIPTKVHPECGKAWREDSTLEVEFAEFSR